MDGHALLNDLFFLHIPKTGGTSIEKAAGRRNSVRMQLCDQKRQHTCDWGHLRNKKLVDVSLAPRAGRLRETQPSAR